MDGITELKEYLIFTREESCESGMITTKVESLSTTWEDLEERITKTVDKIVSENPEAEVCRYTGGQRNDCPCYYIRTLKSTIEIETCYGD